MANNFDSNFTKKLAKGVLGSFESQRVLSKNVNTQKLDGKFDPTTGSTTRFKRPTDYKSKRSANGDISGGTRSDIIRGEAVGEVQDYITVDVDFDEAVQSLEMGNDEQEFYDAMALRIVTDLELDFADFMMKNAALQAGTVGTGVGTWDAVAEAGAVLQSTGVPAGPLCYGVNSYSQRKLASDQRSLGGETGMMTANERATITDNFAGMRVMTATTMGSYTTSAGATRDGTLASSPVQTYVSVKDSYTQQIAVAGFQANLDIKAGERISVAGRNRLNLSTRRPILDDLGNQIVFTAVVTEDVTLDGSGGGTLTISGPAVFEANGAYNTVDSALTTGDVVTLLAAESSIIQPNMFWHKDAFSIGSVPIKKLFSTDTIGTTNDGLQMRVSKYADGDANKQIVRIDFRPAYCAMNQFWAGHGHG